MLYLYARKWGVLDYLFIPLPRTPLPWAVPMLYLSTRKWGVLDYLFRLLPSVRWIVGVVGFDTTSANADVPLHRVDCGCRFDVTTSACADVPLHIDHFLEHPDPGR